MIRLLSEQTINQIAAGEVIENPASVVKELIENSLDAGAKQISIEIGAGGMQLIRVADNGVGMNREDALLSLKRHATSKIQEAEDLFQLLSLGFRGEALASIAAISHLTLITAQEKQVGIKIEVEGGETKIVEPCARTRGTTIEVRSLFYNVPARKKFQSSIPVSASEIFRLVTVFCLSHPEVGFELISNGKKTISTFAEPSFEEALACRVSELLGEDYAKGSTNLHFSQGSLLFQGLLGSPMRARSNRRGQYLFINRRAVVCPLIQETIKEAYGTRIGAKSYPIFLLHLSFPSDLVDVNVHPQKKEIRLRDDHFFKEKLLEAIALTFRSANSVALSFVQEAVYEPLKIQENFLPMKFQEVAEGVQEPLLREREIRPVGFFSHYLILEGWSLDPQYDGIVMVDIKACLRRLLFDQLMKGTPAQKETQGMIVPYTLHLSSLDSAMVLTHLPSLESLGFAIRPIGRDLFIIEATPPFLDEIEAKEAIMEMALKLQTLIGKKSVDEEKKEQLAFIASSRAKMKNQYSLEEASVIFKKTLDSASPKLCPKGHSIMVHLNLYEMGKLFEK